MPKWVKWASVMLAAVAAQAARGDGPTPPASTPGEARFGDESEVRPSARRPLKTWNADSTMGDDANSLLYAIDHEVRGGKRDKALQ